MRAVAAGLLLALLTVVQTGCGSCGPGPEAGPDAGLDATPFTDCTGDNAEYTRAAMLALLGRRAASSDEVRVYVDLANAVELAAGSAANGTAGRAAIADALMKAPEFTARWTDQLMDALKVQRTDIQSQGACWATASRNNVDPALAEAVRDGAASTTVPDGRFTMLDLARSSLALDDITPVLRGQVFVMTALPIPAANVPPVEAELARRDDFGTTFDSAYLRRDMVCLACHNSRASITDSDDPLLDRHHPVEGLPELALYGSNTGIDPDRAHAAFRVDGFVNFDGAGTRPWGWESECGTFSNPASIGNDPAEVDGLFGSMSGQRLTVYDLDRALRAGFEALRGAPPEFSGGDGTFADPDVALAWLVSLSVVESMWREVIGHPLTIANYFPRNDAARIVLSDLTREFVTSGYSLRALLAAIVASDYFARQAPDAGCGAGPYSYPAIFDPWVISDEDPERRGNGPGDAIAPLSARTLVTASQTALDWPATGIPSFPFSDDGFCSGSCGQLTSACNSFNACCAEAAAVCSGAGTGDIEFERGIGVFLRNGESGFRGLDFQARLAWEQRMAACEAPSAAADFITTLITAADGDTQATVADVVVALKDRLIGEPRIDSGAESQAVAALLGLALDQPGAMLDESRLRLLCGALLESPQFMLQGIVAPSATDNDTPRLTPAAHQYQNECETLAGRVTDNYTLACSTDSLTLMP